MTRPAYPTSKYGLMPARLLLAVFLAVLCAALVARPVFAQSADKLDANSRINVTVAGEPEVSGDFVVDTTGNITMLYVNQIHVGGLTVPETQKAIADKLATIYRNPQVLVKLVGRGGIAVSVSGAVGQPGEHALRSDSHLNDVLQISSPNVNADLAAVEITHGRPGEKHSKDTVNYLSFLNNQNVVGNPPLQDGDVIFVRSKDEVPIQVNIRGQVEHPGQLSVPARSTFLDAVQAAGGLLVSADRKNISIQHTNVADENTVDYQIAQLNPDDKNANPSLRDGDTIIIKAVEKPNVYTIVGGVEHPGQFTLPTTPISLADALGIAGGPAPRAKMKQTTITRNITGQPQVMSINGDDQAVLAKTLVMAGDNINIPPGSTPPPPISPIALFGIAISLFGLFHH